MNITTRTQVTIETDIESLALIHRVLISDFRDNTGLNQQQLLAISDIADSIHNALKPTTQKSGKPTT